MLKLFLTRRLLTFLVGPALVLGLLVLGVNLYVVRGQSDDTTTKVAELKHAQVAIVLGALVHEDGVMSAMLTDRVDRGAELWKAGKVDRIIVSGDHGTWKYDEPTVMRMELQKRGVPGSAVFTDHAGFNTWASMVRARKIFGVKSAIVVTQKFHMARALYLADAAGLEARGLTSDLGPYGSQQTVSDVREMLARVKAFGQATFDTKVMLGPKIPLTDDSRRSWGPQSPPPGVLRP